MNIIPEIPNDPKLTTEEARQEGTISTIDEALGIDLSDYEILQIVSGRVEASVSFWNSKLQLDAKRAEGERYYYNYPYKEGELYDHQVPYKNNRIFVDVESLVSLAVSNPAEPVVTEANDTDASRQLATDLQNVLKASYEDDTYKAKLTKTARHLLMGKRVGVWKYRFDPNLGKILPDGSRKGAIIFETRRPEKVVVAANTGPGENPLFIAEYLSDTIETLIHRFPAKKEAILKKYGYSRGSKKFFQTEVGYIEFWFTYYDKQGNVQEGVCWKLQELLLGKMKNPNWNYDGYEVDKLTGQAISLNFFEFPQKPYIFFTHIDTDEWFYDETSLMDHAIPQQDILNKRGRQIVENADQASGGIIYDQSKISQADMAKLVGAADEKIGISEGDVRAAVGRLPFNPLPQYVIEDKMQARAEIDNIFGANAPIKGEKSDLETLGQDILSQRANLGRLQPLADALEDGMDKVYKAKVQMMKVYWDAPELVRFRDSDGKTRFLNYSADKIEDGVAIRVRAGSALPKDKFAVRNETVQMAATLDPLSLAEGLDKENPKEFAKRLIFYRFFMDRYLNEVLGEGADGTDSQAAADIQALVAGEPVQLPDDVSKQYLATFDSFIRSGQFKTLNPEVKRRIVDFVVAASSKAKAALGEQGDEQKQIEQGGEPEANQPAPATPQSTPTPPAKPTDGQQSSAGGNILSRGFNALKQKLGI